jgi:hypothetical protein
MHQRNYIAIHVRGKAAVEPALGATRRLPAREGRKIKVWKPDRLFQLVNPVAGKKDLRHVRFMPRNLQNRRAIGVPALQEFDLVGERRWQGRNRA